MVHKIAEKMMIEPPANSIIPYNQKWSRVVPRVRKMGTGASVICSAFLRTLVVLFTGSRVVLFLIPRVQQKDQQKERPL
jgi:hypothetical protein